jgi:DNA-binding NarL/FixJ family response regulator
VIHDDKTVLAQRSKQGMARFSVLLATGRPAVASFFIQLGQSATPPFTVAPIPVPVESATLALYAEHVAAATVAVVDVTPEPVAAVQFCHEMRAQRPTLPIAALFCCPHAVTLWHLRMLFGAGVSNLLDLQATGAEVLRVLQSIARGDTVYHVQLTGQQGVAVEDIATGQGLGGETVFGSQWNATIVRILELLVHGLTDQEIGMQVHLSPHTIKHHIERVRDEVGTRNRIALAAWASRNGFYRPAGGRRARGSSSEDIKVQAAPAAPVAQRGGDGEIQDSARSHSLARNYLAANRCRDGHAVPSGERQGAARPLPALQRA